MAFLTVEQLAERWQVDPKWVRRRIWSGELHARKFGNRVRVPAEEAQRFEASLPAA